jgi:hypothetical protein
MMKVGKEELLKLLNSLGGEWIVSSTPFGCAFGNSKIYLRKKRGKSGGIIYSDCLPDEEVKKIKNSLKKQIR